MALKLTDVVVKRLPVPATGKTIVFDSEVSGFACCIYASGKRAFVLDYRTRSRRQRRITIGSFPDWGTAAARSEAAELKQTVDRGGDPLGDVKATRTAPTVNDLCDSWPSTCHGNDLRRSTPIAHKLRARSARHSVR
jgi:hypothetical protein